MKLIRKNGHWIVALLGIVSLAYSAGMMHERLPVPTLATTQAREAVPAHAPREAEALSSGFRHAAKAALPAMVSIEVRGKAQARASGREGNPQDLFDGSPFGELFKHDPRLKDLLKNQQGQSMPRSHGMGSGFIIDSSGIILTNNHVVADADQVKVKLHDGREFIATDVKTDPRTDVAIVRIKADASLPTIRMGDSDAVEIGDWVLAIGSPFGLDATVTAGIISAKGRGLQGGPIIARTSCRPTRPSTPATAAARLSTSPEKSWGSTRPFRLARAAMTASALPFRSTSPNGSPTS